MTRSERYEIALSYFAKSMPNAKTELNYTTDFELLIAVVLSAQCTDKRVNMVTPALFSRYPDAKSMATATAAELLPYISSVSYPIAKSQYLAGLSRMIVEEFNGQVPSTREELMRLPGVGRKTANVMLAVIFGVGAMPVDTHVFRVANRLGLTKNSKNVEQTERELTKWIPSDMLIHAHHWLVLFGRYTCTALSPRCDACALMSLCTLRNPEENEEFEMLP